MSVTDINKFTFWGTRCGDLRLELPTEVKTLVMDGSHPMGAGLMWYSTGARPTIPMAMLRVPASGHWVAFLKCNS